jgi:glycosyltransferase involved in cell wall biosynthesis
MKIGIDAKCFIGNYTGVGNYCYHLLDELIKLRPDDQFYLFSNKKITIDLENVNIVYADGFTARSGILWLMTKVPGLLRKYGIDVFWGASGLLPYRTSKVKTILSVYDFVWLRYPKTMPYFYRFALSIFTKSSIKNSTKIITISKSIAKEISEYFRRDDAEIILPSVSAAYRKCRPADVAIVKDKYNIIGRYYLIVGTLEPRKNLETFLRAYCDAADSFENTHDAKLILVGGKGWRNSDLIARIEYMEGRGLARRLGYVDESDLPALYTGASAFFMPSLYEGFGMPVLEAYSCGTPVVISDTDALSEACCGIGTFHSPSYGDILKILKGIFSGKISPPEPILNLVDWSWRSGALQLSQVIDSVLSEV